MISRERYELERMTKVQRFFYGTMSEQDQASYVRMSNYESNLYSRLDTQNDFRLDDGSLSKTMCSRIG